MNDTAHLSAYSGLVIQPYRDDQNRPRWVFRCWGTNQCDGWLSLDHYSEQSASRALTSHIAEFHTSGSSVPEVKIRITGGLTEAQREEVKRIIGDAMRKAEREGRVSR